MYLRFCQKRYEAQILPDLLKHVSFSCSRFGRFGEWHSGGGTNSWLRKVVLMSVSTLNWGFK